jgi:hypothetical protein
MAVGIGAIVLAGITTMITDVFKSQRTAQSKEAHRELTANIRQLLTDPAICSVSFKGSNPSGTGYTKTQIVDAATPSNVKYQTGVDYLNHLVTITGFEVRGFVADNPPVNDKIGKAELNIKMNKLGSTIGSPQMTTTVFLQATLDASYNLNSCYALGLADSLWQISPANMADIYYSSGNVGIGTTAPTSLLDLKGSAGANGLYIRTTSSAPNSSPYGIEFSNNLAGTAHVGIEMDYLGNFRIEKDNSNVFISITQSGNVGIGTNSPSNSKLEVNSTNTWAIVGNGSQHGVQGSTTNSNNFAVQGYNSAGGGSGALGYGNWGVWCVQTNCGGNAGWTNVSDRRLKRDIQPLDGALEKILKLRGVSFHWKDQNRDRKEGEKIGLIAQEVEEVFPQAVLTNSADKKLPGGSKMLTTGDLIGPIIQAIKELHGKFLNWQKTQENRFNALEAENKAMKTYICQKDPKAGFCSK